VSGLIHIAQGADLPSVAGMYPGLRINTLRDPNPEVARVSLVRSWHGMAMKGEARQGNEGRETCSPAVPPRPGTPSLRQGQRSLKHDPPALPGSRHVAVPQKRTGTGYCREEVKKSLEKKSTCFRHGDAPVQPNYKLPACVGRGKGDKQSRPGSIRASSNSGYRQCSRLTGLGPVQHQKREAKHEGRTWKSPSMLYGVQSKLVSKGVESGEASIT
jgi:hypothetical protein